MSTQEIEIPKFYEPEFTKIQEHLLRKGGSLLMNAMNQGSHKGEGAQVVKQYGKGGARVGVDDRQGDTPIMTTPRSQRWVYPTLIDTGDLFDKQDEIRQLIDPTSMINEGFKMSMGEQLDASICIPAFFGDARTGKNGADTTVFPATANDVNVQLGSANGATDTGMNVAKLVRARRILESRYVKFGRETVFCGLSAQESEELLNDAKYSNRDYGIPVLDNGMLKPFLGFTFVQLEEWEVVSGVRHLPVWAKSGMHLGIWESLNAKIGPDPSKKFNVRVYMSQTFGCTRTQENKIVRINSKVIAAQ